MDTQEKPDNKSQTPETPPVVEIAGLQLKHRRGPADQTTTEQVGKKTVEKGKTDLEYVGIGEIPPRMTSEETRRALERADRKMEGRKSREASPPEEDYSYPERDERLAEAEQLRATQELAAATPDVGTRGPGVGESGISGPIAMEQYGSNIQPGILAELNTGAAGPSRQEVARAEKAMAPKRAPDSERWTTETFYAINFRQEERDESAWLKKAIEAGGEKKYPGGDGAEYAWKKFQRAYVNRFRKSSRPTGAEIHKFQADWCKNELGIDLYANVATAKAEAGARTIVEVGKPLRRDINDPLVQKLFGGLQYELAQRIGLGAEHLSPQFIMSLYGIFASKDLPENWGKPGDRLVFNPVATDKSSDAGSLAFVSKTDGEYRVVAQKPLNLNAPAIAALKTKVDRKEKAA